MPRVALAEDEVQGDQESGLQSEDGHADGDGVAPPHASKRGKIVRAPQP